MEALKAPPCLLAAYCHRAVSRKEVVEWADRKTLSTDSPPEWIIELATASFERNHEFIRLLENQGLKLDLPLSDRLSLIAIAREECGMDFETAVPFLYDFYMEDTENLIPDSAQSVVFERPDWDRAQAKAILSEILGPFVERGRQLRREIIQDSEQAVGLDAE